ncbi:MAG: glycoside hydrolase family 3 protein, partial [Oscillospiraceae bacterium]|nr:glycoside hydrolase family 3 protein [Oscillospiraceae bacterium]
MQRTAVENSRFNIPMFLSIDQEGGYIVRLDTKGTIMPGNMAVGSSWDPDMAYKTGKVIGEELAAIGCNINFGPVLDVNSNPDNPVIGLRSFGDDPEMVGLMGAAYTAGIQEAGVIAAGKHFPGHGNTATDTHSTLSTVPGDYDYLMANDWLPYKIAIEGGLDMVMTGHLSLPEFDDTMITGTRSGETFSPPGTMSKRLLTDILRGDLGFEGLIVTDSMRMGALTTHFGTYDAVELAIMAGVDLPLMPIVSESNANVTNNVAPLYAEMGRRANEKPELMARIDESVVRILKYKMDKGLYDPDAGLNQPCFDTPLNDRIAHANATMRSEEHLAIEKEVSKASVVLAVNEEINGKPVLPFSLKAGDSVFIIQPTDYVNVTLFRNAMDDYLSKVGLTGQVTVTSQSFSANPGSFIRRAGDGLTYAAPDINAATVTAPPSVPIWGNKGAVKMPAAGLSLFGSDNEQVIALDGTFYRPLVDMTVNVMYQGMFNGNLTTTPINTHNNNNAVVGFNI